MRAQGGRANRLLTIVCAGLIAIDLFYIPLALLSIPSYLARVSTLAIPEFGAGIGDLLTSESAAALAAERGMTPSGFAWYGLAVRLFAAAVFTGVGLLVLLRARAHWFGWLTAHVMFFMNSFALFQVIQVASLLPPAAIEFSALFWPSILVYFFLFPRGEFVPRWMGPPILVYAVGQFLAQLLGLLAQAGLLAPEWFESWLVPVFNFLIPIIFLAALASQVFRYFRVSTAVERAQTRWFILAIVVLIGLPELGSLLGLERLFVSFEWELLSFTMIPIALAVAILRYRLWDIDVIIRKTLQYAVLTALLAVVYFGGIVLLQGVFGGLIGAADSPLFTVVTTLGVAALFNPIRSRVQSVVDRRFYRRKFNAEQMLSSFSQVARNEVDLNNLVNAIMDIAAESVQPVKLTAWIRETKR